jgi:hypothetical protein
MDTPEIIVDYAQVIQTSLAPYSSWQAPAVLSAFTSLVSEGCQTG